MLRVAAVGRTREPGIAERLGGPPQGVAPVRVGAGHKGPRRAPFHAMLDEVAQHRERGRASPSGRHATHHDAGRATSSLAASRTARCPSSSSSWSPMGSPRTSRTARRRTHGNHAGAVRGWRLRRASATWPVTACTGGLRPHPYGAAGLGAQLRWACHSVTLTLPTPAARWRHRPAAHRRRSVTTGASRRPVSPGASRRTPRVGAVVVRGAWPHRARAPRAPCRGCQRPARRLGAATPAGAASRGAATVVLACRRCTATRRAPDRYEKSFRWLRAACVLFLACASDAAAARDPGTQGATGHGPAC